MHQERSLDANDPALLDHQIAWMHYLPHLLILLGDKNPLCSQVLSEVPVLFLEILSWILYPNWRPFRILYQ